MNISEYQKLSERTLPDYVGDLKGSVSNYSMGLAGESGEVIDILKKSFHHDHNLDLYAVEEELGDVLHYIAGITTMLGLSLESIATANIEKLRQRYPKGFSAHDSINRKV
ncbi:nucleoside triphosphate pyrophosphohydrolase family protein [Sporosarcina highlanderae]|uniref:Nucleoside triphosphate pyrophosphohydrolase family protein n=1 Tax=Sporosarcina highlanderae TaxID=3035916 RepID=A0ABT8JVD9_9BACL|nr:nucleoside triphosphate pyrophosphohydrolase family protein [Sporosarcina highlanderae]MDN4609141.1 nucleoside triphosphate pyrophosphohydrolase family protein [Sporosarcina highlanderae]